MRCIVIILFFLMTSLVPSPAQADRAEFFSADNAAHLGASFGLTCLGYALGAELFEGRGPRVGFSAGFSLTFGIGKEILDLAGFGDAELRDLLMDVIGTAVALLICWAIDRVISLYRHNRLLIH